jgi:hypothetical protein
MMRVITLAASVVTLSATQLFAQGGDGRRCQVVNGIVATVSGDSSMRTRDTSFAVQPGSSRSVIDTSWTFNINERHWSWSALNASVGAGLSGGATATRSAGMTTAPDSAAGHAWTLCAAAAIGMRNATLTLRGAHGTVRLRTDLTPLQRTGRTMDDSTSRPRR